MRRSRGWPRQVNPRSRARWQRLAARLRAPGRENGPLCGHAVVATVERTKTGNLPASVLAEWTSGSFAARSNQFLGLLPFHADVRCVGLASTGGGLASW